MVREFVSDVLRGRRMARDVRECRTALSGVFLVIGASEHNLLARFVRIGVEDEGPWFAKSAQAAGKAGPTARKTAAASSSTSEFATVTPNVK